MQVEQHVLRELKRMIKSPKMLEELCVVANEKFKAEQPNFDELIRAENNKILGITRQLDKITDEILMSGSTKKKLCGGESLQASKRKAVSGTANRSLGGSQAVKAAVAGRRDNQTGIG
ncbi:MAG: hypothetical protein R2827_03585 [Bdellovibrionales bacterium]